MVKLPEQMDRACVSVVQSHLRRKEGLVAVRISEAGGTPPSPGAAVPHMLKCGGCTWKLAANVLAYSRMED